MDPQVRHGLNHWRDSMSAGQAITCQETVSLGLTERATWERGILVHTAGQFPAQRLCCSGPWHVLHDMHAHVVLHA